MPLVSVEQAIKDFKAGKMLILVDDETRENEGDLCIPAQNATPEALCFMIKHTSGIVCLAMSGTMLDNLQLPMMVENNQNKFHTGFTVSIEARDGVTTGVSAFDRARTIQVAIDPQSTAADLNSPGHIFPLRAQKGGVFARQGHTEASVDLARLAGFSDAAVICEIMDDDGHMARMPSLEQFAQRHNINIVSIHDLLQYRIRHDNIQHMLCSALLPAQGEQLFQMKLFEDQLTQLQTVVMVSGELDTSKPVLVRLHSECLTGDVFGSIRCDCGQQLAAAQQMIAEQGGVLIYLRQEGRGIGLANKIKAYALQEQGLDTVEANHELGFPADARDYSVAAQILHQLGITNIRLLTNNPQKIKSLTTFGFKMVSREALQTTPTSENLRYLQTKQQKLAHLFDNLEEQIL